MSELANILGPVAIITLIGYLLERLKVGLDTHTIGAMVLLVATPSLIFHTLVSMDVDTKTLGTMAFAALLAMSASAVFGMLVLLLSGASLRAFLPSLVFPNSGNMGLALVLLTFGNEGMKLGISYFFMVSIVQHSIGFSIAIGKFDLRYLARQPLLYSVALVLIVTRFDVAVPEIVMTTTQMLGGVMIPCMLILLGASLASLKVSDLGPALGIGFARLIFGITSALLAIWLLDLNGMAAGTVFLLATMPTAIVNHIYASRYGNHGTAVSGAVAVSTFLTFLCLPALITAALWISNNG
ncbi:AEC family transporter [Planktotalea sp.]|uniref:AEC family transporter n=1 Tax=Planktotalea sp. TaxID=2029877 RepID=UPI00329A3195